MLTGMDSLSERISAVRKRIVHAAMRAGRQPQDVMLIAVTKTVPVARIREAAECGLRAFGENRVQEAQKKIMSDEVSAVSEEIEWHLIGHLQRNKAKHAVGLFDCIHSLDSAGLAEEINRHAEKIGKVQDVLIEVKLSHEKTKHGVPSEELPELLRVVRDLANLNLRGLMTIPPFFEDPEAARPYFRELRELRDGYRGKGFALRELSMGMSDDFEAAIEEGATMVRVGTAIFGTRS
ncbi:MAG: YggS family pyridoxal phosphate-dependent enzyme [Nitrospirae bacterium]|nr:YggS family pyridoxal phosphate-dependent enzyme [Nitrospirota bacterium]